MGEHNKTISPFLHKSGLYGGVVEDFANISASACVNLQETCSNRRFYAVLQSIYSGWLNRKAPHTFQIFVIKNMLFFFLTLQFIIMHNLVLF